MIIIMIMIIIIIIIIKFYIAHISIFEDAQGTCIIITLALAPATQQHTVHLKGEIPAGYPLWEHCSVVVRALDS